MKGPAQTLQQKEAARKGRLRFGRWFVRFRRRSRHQFGRYRDLQSWCSKLLPKFLLMTGSPVVVDAATSEKRVRCVVRIQVEIEMLPAGEDMHRGRVRSPARRRGPSAGLPSRSRLQHCRIAVPSFAKTPIGILAGAAGWCRRPELPGSARGAKPSEHVVVLAPLAEEHGGASRHPSSLDTGLHVPNVGLVGCAVDEACPVLKLKLWHLRAVVLLALIQAIDEQA